MLEQAFLLIAFSVPRKEGGQVRSVSESVSEIDVTEEKSVSSVAETVPKHETVQEVTVDRT